MSEWPNWKWTSQQHCLHVPGESDHEGEDVPVQGDGGADGTYQIHIHYLPLAVGHSGYMHAILQVHLLSLEADLASMDVGAYLCSPPRLDGLTLDSHYHFRDPPMSPGVGQPDCVVPLAGQDDPSGGLTFRFVR